MQWQEIGNLDTRHSSKSNYLFLEYFCSVLIGYIPLNGRKICVQAHKHQSLKNSRLASTKEGFRWKYKSTRTNTGVWEEHPPMCSYHVNFQLSNGTSLSDLCQLQLPGTAFECTDVPIFFPHIIHIVLRFEDLQRLQSYLLFEFQSLELTLS